MSTAGGGLARIGWGLEIGKSEFRDVGRVFGLRWRDGRSLQFAQDRMDEAQAVGEAVEIVSRISGGDAKKVVAAILNL